jgi:hypothetical protein
MSHPVAPQESEAYQQMLLAEVKGGEQANAAGSRRPALSERILVGIGGFLIAVGVRLVVRYGPAVSCGCECHAAAAGTASA